MNWYQRIPIEKFNQVCALIATLWLSMSVPLGISMRPTIPDFEQFYLGGVIVSQDEWNALYPIPHKRSLDNPGLSIHSAAKPKWKQLSRELGVWDHTHFMLPPPSAMVFTPFSLFSYKKALWVWTALLTFCVWATALVSGAMVRDFFESPTRWEGVLVLLIAFSPMTARAIRIANVSPPVALAIAGVLYALVHNRHDLRGAFALLVGAIFKYATLVLTPLLIAMKRWRMLFYVSALGLLTLGLALIVAGTEPFIEFYKVILPTLSRPSAFRGNQTLPGMLARVFGRPLSPGISLTLNCLRLLTLGAVFLLLFSLRQVHWRKAVNVAAATAMLTSWLLIFSPIAWEHWPIFLCPVWGWLIWELSQNRGIHRTLAVVSLVLMYLPAGIFQVRGFARYPLVIPEPFNSTQLIGHVLVLALAFLRLTPLLAKPAKEQP